MSEGALIDQFAAWLRSLDGRVTSLEGERRPSEASAAGGDTEPDEVFSATVSDADIRAAYRLLLNREPDAVGLAHYRSQADQESYRLRDLADGLARSDEAVARRAAEIQSIDVGSVVVSVDVAEREFGRAIARDGTWEAHIIQTIRGRLKPGDVFVDVGANIGVMSFHAAQAVGPGGKVIAFEPNPDNIQRFLQGVLLNGFDHVLLYPVGASDQRSIFSVRGGSNSYLGAANLGGVLVQSMVADRLLASEPRIDFIKLDIEGHEPHALAGLAGTIARHKPTLLCEFNPRCLRDTLGLDPARFAEQLFGLAASIDVVEHDGALTPVATPVDLMTLWSTRNIAHVESGDLPDGMVHFDLLVRTRR